MGKIYNLQCINHGYIGICQEDDPLYEQCVQREKDGYIDALCIGPKECYLCIEEQQKNDAIAKAFEGKTDEEIGEIMFWMAVNI